MSSHEVVYALLQLAQALLHKIDAVDQLLYSAEQIQIRLGDGLARWVIDAVDGRPHGSWAPMRVRRMTRLLVLRGGTGGVVGGRMWLILIVLRWKRLLKKILFFVTAAEFSFRVV